MENNFNKLICPKCNGNGYVTKFRHIDFRKSEHIDCNNCNNQGEIKIYEKEKR